MERANKTKTKTNKRKDSMRKTLIAVVAGLAVTACLTATATVQPTVIDVTSASGTGNGVNVSGAFFHYADPQPTGTGFIDPFLREQAHQGEATEFGVNTDIKAQVMNSVNGTGILPGTFWDNKNPVNYTHDLAVNNLMAVSPGVYRFFLDNNNVNGNISLTTLKFFYHSTAFTDAAALTTFVGGTAGLLYNMQSAASPNHPFQVDVATDHGSGSGDMYVDVPLTLPSTGFLYMVAGFGETGYGAVGGFEEWWTRSGVPNIAPDSASALGLLGIALTGLEVLRRKIRA
jgi:hypothetical protein